MILIYQAWNTYEIYMISKLIGSLKLSFLNKLNISEIANKIVLRWQKELKRLLMDIVDTYERFSSSQIQNYEYSQSNINFIDIIDEHYIAEKTILF